MGLLSVAAIPKILVLLFLVCLTRVAAGSCLSYGHSCWGGHGKRSSPHVFNPLNLQKQNDEFYFSKFFKLLKEKTTGSTPFYNSYSKDFRILDKLIKAEHFKRYIRESVEDGLPREENTEEFGYDTDLEEPENNDMNTEELFIPAEAKLIWNSKLRAMQKMIDKARKTG